MAPFTDQALQFIRTHGLMEPHQHVVAAVSGGPDSVALLHLLVSLRTWLSIHRLSVVHFDHGLRGKESEEDRDFVESLARKLGLPFLWGSSNVDGFRRQHGVSLEMAARTCRHQFFAEAMDRLGARVLALGHTANDQAEELLLRLLRGTGPAGLSGMLPKGEQGIVRPLLFCTREQVLNYLDSRNIPFREDSSNSAPTCQRNSLRIEILPVLKKRFHPRVVETLCRHARLVQDEEDYWSRHLEEVWPTVCAEEAPGLVALSVTPLSGLHQAVQRRILRLAIQRTQGNSMGITSTHVENIRHWMASGSARSQLHLPGRLRLVREAHRIVFSLPEFQEVFPPPDDPTVSHPVQVPGSCTFLGQRLDFSWMDGSSLHNGASFQASRQRACMDADKILWPLTLRRWLPGDRFQPLGLHGSKKIQDFFTDARIPASRRKHIPLLCDGEKICWVVGHRLDERVKVSPETSRAVTAQLTTGPASLFQGEEP